MASVLSYNLNPRSAALNLITLLRLEAFTLIDNKHFPLTHSHGAYGQALSQRLI